jgi:hypothetical protein
MVANNKLNYFTVLLVLFCSNSAQASGWVRDVGKGLFIQNASYYSTNKFYDNNQNFFHVFLVKRTWLRNSEPVLLKNEHHDLDFIGVRHSSSPESSNDISLVLVVSKS